MAELTISIRDLRNHFDEYLSHVKSGQTFLITKYGKQIAEFTPAVLVQKEPKPSRVKAKKKQLKD